MIWGHRALHANRGQIWNGFPVDYAVRTRVVPSCELQITISVARRCLPSYSVGTVVLCMLIHVRARLLEPSSTQREAMSLIRRGHERPDEPRDFAK